MIRGIAVGLLVLWSSMSWGAEYCEQLLKEDFRETSNIKLIYHDSGIILENDQPTIYKIKYGSPASSTGLRKGDQIISFNQEPIAEDLIQAQANLANILQTSAMRDVDLEVLHLDGTTEAVSLVKKSFLGYPMVEADFIFKDIDIIEQSSKTSLDLEIHLRWKNEALMYVLAKQFNFRPNELNCQFRKQQELDQVLQKIWYPAFKSDQTGSSIQDIQYEQLLVTNNTDSDANFILKQKINYQINNKSDFSKFPFDHLSMTADFLFQDADIIVPQRYDPSVVIEQGNQILYEWNITDHQLECCKSEAYGIGTKQTVEYQFDLTRKYFYYLLKIILPIFFLVILSFSVFLIRVKELESKLAVTIGSLLTLVAYNFVFGDDVPKLNYITILDAWILLSYLFAGLSTFITIFSYWDYHREKQTGFYNTHDKKLRVLVPLSYIFSLAFVWWGITYNWSLSHTLTALSV
jgi:hypothetical protein